MWDPTPISALAHGPGLDGNGPLPRRVSRVYYIRNGRPSLVLGDNHSLMGGNDDMKSGVVTMEIVGILRVHIYVSRIALGMYIVGYIYILYMSHYLG